MKKNLLFLVAAFLLTATNVFSQCANNGSFTPGDLTPLGVGQTTDQTFASGQYMLAYVNAGANYTISTCGNSSFDTQLTVYDDANGAFYAYNDDYCGLQSTVNFTAPTCGYVRVTLMQYSCNSSGLSTIVHMTMNSAGFVAPTRNTALRDTATCPGIPVMIGNTSFISGGVPPFAYAWTASTGLNDSTLVQPTATINSTTTYMLTVRDSNNCAVRDTLTVTANPVPTRNLGNDTVQCGGTVMLDAGNAGNTYAWNDASTAQTLTADTTQQYYVTVTNSYGCVNSDSVQVTINPLPVVNLGADTTQCTGIITLDAGNAGFNYLWSDASSMQTLTVSNSGTYHVTVTNPATSCFASDTIMVTIDSMPVVNLGMDTTQCTGTIVLDAGNAGLMYLWNDASTMQTLTVSSTGMYAVTVTNGSCSAADSINVTIDAMPVVNLGMDTAQCSGTIVLDAGNTGTTYLWNDASTMQTLTAGSTGMYAVTVTNGSCSAADSINVTIDAMPVVNLGMDTTQCTGTIVLDARNAGLTYLWNDASTMQTLTVSSTGMYAVAVTNGTCVASDSINVTIDAMPVVNLGTDTTQCGGTIVLDAGNTGAMYLWDDASTMQTSTASSTGLYYVTVTNGSCAASDSINVTINPIPAVAIDPLSTTCANYPAITLTGTPAGGVYSGTAVSAGTFDPSTAGAGSFLITYTLTDGNGCINMDTTTIMVNVCAGIATIAESELSIYPNPANNEFNIAFTNADFDHLMISITDLQGKEVYSYYDKNISPEYRKTINTEGLAKGIYYIKLNTGKNILMKKLVIQ